MNHRKATNLHNTYEDTPHQMTTYDANINQKMYVIYFKQNSWHWYLSLFLQDVDTYLSKEGMKYLSIAAFCVPRRACYIYKKYFSNYKKYTLNKMAIWIFVDPIYRDSKVLSTTYVLTWRFCSTAMRVTNLVLVVGICEWRPGYKNQ